jgi:adenylate cyclase class 2
LPHESEPARVEVELKFRVAANGNNSQRANVHHAAHTKCAKFQVGDSVTEADEYYTSATMQADTYLRIRTINNPKNSWEEVQITWKGPLLGDGSKSRREENVSLRGDDADALRRMLVGLGYSRFVSVYKERQTFKLTHAGYEITMSFDRVRGLGEFVELEVLTIEPARLGAEAVLLDLARLLGLKDQERRGYAAMAVLADQSNQ